MLFLDKDKCGFTLIEIMLVVVIMSIVLISIALLFSVGGAFIVEIKERSIATKAANEEMELIRDMNFDNILALGSSFTAAGFSSLNNPTGTVTVDNPYGTDDMRRITTTVTWTSCRGRVLSKTLVMLVTREGINRQ